MRLATLLLIAPMQLAALRGCTALESWDWQSSAIANPTPQAQACERYGDGRGLSEEQAIAARNLAWPQTYDAVLNRLGYPDCRAPDHDVYRLPSGWRLSIYYSGAIATGIEINPPANP
jgi:hypothetical protein